MKNQMLWTSAKITKQQLCFLDGISKNAKFSGGKKFSRASVLRSVLGVAKKLNIDVGGVRSEEELEHRFLSALKNHVKAKN